MAIPKSNAIKENSAIVKFRERSDVGWIMAVRNGTVMKRKLNMYKNAVWLHKCGSGYLVA